MNLNIDQFGIRIGPERGHPVYFHTGRGPFSSASDGALHWYSYDVWDEKLRKANRGWAVMINTGPHITEAEAMAAYIARRDYLYAAFKVKHNP